MTEVYRTAEGGIYEVDRRRMRVRAVEHPETEQKLAAWTRCVDVNHPRGTPLVVTWFIAAVDTQPTYQRGLVIGEVFNVFGHRHVGTRQFWSSPVTAIEAP